MPVIAVVALMGFLFLPGSAGAPAHAETISAPVAIAGTAEEPSKRLATSKEVAQTYQVSMTAYNAVPGQTDDNPFVTASGMASISEVVAARSRDMAAELPFGTVIRLERSTKDTPSCRFSEVEHQIGYRIIADTMHWRWNDKIDVLLDHTDTVPVEGRMVNPALALGHCNGVTITVVGRVDMKNPPTTQAELAAMFAEPTYAVR
ncbi:MAG TPA: hypothetical protein PK609_02745 [Candidatus Paceibacterota bacterium]|nr:hypothetical protein [Candidatus Paceibacterota bacterium]